MPQITRDSLMTLEAYAKARQEFRVRVMAHKKNRKIHLGENVTLIFEDGLTIRYQIQEMLRVEKLSRRRACWMNWAHIAPWFLTATIGKQQ
ncbi:MAG: DUF3501 family protein [Nitrosospira sp.]